MPKKKRSDETHKLAGRRCAAATDICCSFCEKSDREVGPLAEGPGRVFICLPCVLLCRDIIENECRRLGIDPKESHE